MSLLAVVVPSTVTDLACVTLDNEVLIHRVLMKMFGVTRASALLAFFGIE